MTPTAAPFDILFEDNHILVIDKPAGMLSQADLSGDLDVLTAAKHWIKARDGKPGHVYLGLVHRLDRPVAGVMVVAKTSKAAGRLSDQIRRRTIGKTYRAIVSGCPVPREGTWEDRLIKDRARKMSRPAQGATEGKLARSNYRVLAESEGDSLVEIDLLTGLHHQIRVQLSSRGHAIIGDRKYGSSQPLLPGRIALYAHALTLRHPTKKGNDATMRFVASPPEHLRALLGRFESYPES